MTIEQLRNHLDRFRDGDRQAFAEIYDRMKTPLFTVICRIARDRETAEDILHDLFVKLYQSPPDDTVGNPRAYIYKMARNLAVNSARRPAADELSDALADPVPPVSETAADRLDIAEGMRRLAADEAEIVSLHLYGGLTFREIAGIAGIPLGTALWKYRRAIGKLRNYLNGGNT
ncbi:MAG: RNA polymerase sigma factor [Oscillospiraceae bacterium]|nr:RNA polymerase sigma factor [Oscillospiraceae bacterium]